MQPKKLGHIYKLCENNKNKSKEKFVILQSIGIIAIKVAKHGQSSTPVDILVDNLIYNSVH